MDSREPNNDFEKELRNHLDLEAEEQSAEGISANEAADRARRAFGNTTIISEDVRAVWHPRWLETFWQDARYGLRQLRKNPTFTLVAIITLALGIGANTAIFSVIEGVLLRPLPFSDPDQLVRIYSTKDGAPIIPNGSGRPGGPSAMDMRDFAQDSRSFQNMAVYDTWRKNVSFGESVAEPEQMWVGLVPRNYFETLDLHPIMGRLFTNDEQQEGKNFVAAITAQLWRNRFGADRAILGRKIIINDEPYTIIAVMSDVIPEWMESKAIQVWTPFTFRPEWTEAARSSRGNGSIARIKPGVSLEQAQADLSIIAARLSAMHTSDQGIGVQLEKLSDTRAHNLRPMLFLLMAAVSLILLIACVNLANLLLARNSVRARELAMRAALGAGRGRLVRQLLVETLLLAMIGGALGLLLARIGLVTLATMHPANLPQLSEVMVDWRVMMFTIVASLITSLLFGVGPALTGTRANPADILKLGSRSATAGSGALRMRNILVVIEMAMSLMLLIGASLLVQSIMRLEAQPLGIHQDHVLKGHFYVPDIRYPNPGTITRLCDQFADKVRAVPGVVEASVTTIFPPNNTWTQMLDIPGHPATTVQEIPSARFGVTDSHFLKTMGIPLIRGRDLAASDNATTSPIALISRQLEQKYFPAEDPIGQRIHIGPPQFLRIPPGTGITDSSDVTIVGVMGDFRNSGLALPTEPQIIVLYSQHPLVNYGFKDIVIRTTADPHALIPEISRQLHTLDADMPFAQVQTIDELIEQQTGPQRFTTGLLALFAGVGLLLATIGIYGVVSFLVAQRKHELAIRIAVGAGAPDVLWLVLKEGLRMASIGASLGLVGVWAGHKLLSGLLFGISAIDPPTFAAAAFFLVAIVLIACWQPAWRASKVDPCVALRAE
jgi:putative ABC transport system permease protein